MLHNFRLSDGDTKELLAVGFVRTYRRAALSALMRQEMAGGDPEPGSGDEAQRRDAACFHPEFSAMRDTTVGGPRNMRRVISMKIGSTVSGLKSGSSARRHHTPSAMIISMVTTASKSTSEGMSPRSAPARNRSISQRFTSASKAAEMRAISGLRRASAEISVHNFTCSSGRSAK